VAAGVLIGGGGIAIATIPATGSGVITSCVNTRTSLVRIIDYQARRRCVRGEKTVSWNSKGATGATGAAGAAGQPDYSLVYNKTAADARFLAIAGKAADSDKVDGVDSSALARGSVTTQSIAVDTSSGTLLSLPGWADVSVLNCNASFANAAITNASGGTTSLWIESSTSTAGSTAGTNWSSAGSPSTPTGSWVRWTLAKVGVGVAVVESRPRWNGTTCSFAITATYPTG
jgi:hypothetical protein